MTEIELAYMAGFVDGEGSIGIVVVAKNKKFVTQLAACNCNLIPIVLLKDTFGGKIRIRTWKNKKWKNSYEWKVTAAKAGKAILSLLPYLRVKQRQAEIVLEAQRLKQKYNSAVLRWNRELKNTRDKQLLLLKDECHKLNKRGNDDCDID